MTDQDEWTMEQAIAILRHPTVDSKLWAEAVEWLLLNGPPDIRHVLQEASGYATKDCFPDLKTTGFTVDGETCYSVNDIAQSLKISTEEALQLIMKKESKHGVRQLFSREETKIIQ